MYATVIDGKWYEWLSFLDKNDYLHQGITLTAQRPGCIPAPVFWLTDLTNARNSSDGSDPYVRRNKILLTLLRLKVKKKGRK